MFGWKVAVEERQIHGWRLLLFRRCDDCYLGFDHQQPNHKILDISANSKIDMGILKKILDWTSNETPAHIDKNRRIASRQLVDEKPAIRYVTEKLPVPAASVLPFAEMDSGPEYPFVMSRTLEAPLEQDSFAAYGDWKEEGADRFQSNGLDGLPSSADGFLDQVVDAFDEAFDRACGSDSMPAHSSGTAGSVQNENDEATIQNLFGQIAGNYSQPVRNFAFELRCGTASKDCIEFLRSSLKMIGDAAETMDLAEAVKRIADFNELLLTAQVAPEKWLEGEIRSLLLDNYNGLVEALPDVFRTGTDERKREDIIIKSLLQQIPGMGRVSFEKLYLAGLGSLHALFVANKEDLAAATSIPAPLCERIVDKFQEHRAKALAISLQEPQSGYCAHLTSLVVELRCQHEELERASAGSALNPELATEKRRRRQLRQRCFLQIVATLAELGDVDLIHKIQRLSFRQRLKKLEDHLETLERTAQSAPMRSAELVSQP